MIVWGGAGGDGTGGVYDPTTDSWEEIPKCVAIEPRKQQFAVWTGAAMLMWGGVSTDPAHSNYYPTDGWLYMPL